MSCRDFFFNSSTDKLGADIVFFLFLKYNKKNYIIFKNLLINLMNNRENRENSESNPYIT